MNQMIRPAPVRRSVTVRATPERAFEIFTSRFSAWWPATHSIGASPLRSAVIEPQIGGRWYEIGQDGSECDWGRVLAFEPPGRLVLAWQIGADWKFDPNLLTEVEIRFTPVGDGTLVELEHRKLEAYGERHEEVRGMIDSPVGGWLGLLSAFATLADAA